MRIFIFCCAVFFITGCKPEVYVPKPQGYYLIDTPLRHLYKMYDEPGVPYKFEYPVFGIISKDTANFNIAKTETKYWLNIGFPAYGAVINFTYKNISKEQPLNQLKEDSYEMSFFHHEKAEYMDHQDFDNGAGVIGEIYTIGGDVATRYQFTATDSQHHFIRGALYFDASPNVDSLKPITDFILQDIQHLLFTLRWKD
jgi:gliding motility-associated lipoprotein GldD